MIEAKSLWVFDEGPTTEDPLGQYVKIWYDGRFMGYLPVPGDASDIEYGEFPDE